MSLPSTPEKSQILVIEDSPTQALLLKESLESHNFNVRVAKDGVEGLQLLSESLPDFIISDIEMPRMNGYEFCHHVRQDDKFKFIPVILLTNLTDVMDAIKGIECGADSFITKPCNIEFLISTMADVIRNRKNGKVPSIDNKIDVFFGGQKHSISVNEMQVTDLLLSTFSAAIQKNVELEKAYRKLNLITEEIENKSALLEQLNKEKNQFIGMAAHDLRNPLAIIQGYSQLLLEKLDTTSDEKSIQMLNSIRRSSSSMLELINDLLNVSVIESGIVNLMLSKFNLITLLDEIFDSINKLALNKKITLVKDCECSSDLEIYADRNKIEQVIINLLTNAFKYSYPESTVKVTLSVNSNEEVLISFKDQGVGIPESDKDKLFKPFIKTSVKATAGESSTGLGLVIVKKIVEAHEGKIWFESEPNKGTTFFVSLPINGPSKNRAEVTK